MIQYLNLLQEVTSEGWHKPDRTGTGCTELMGPQMRFNMKLGFPAVTTKRLYWGSALDEILWFLSGEQFIQSGGKNVERIWKNWAAPDGDAGRIYGVQWRHWNVFHEVEWHPESGMSTGKLEDLDQVSALMHGLLNDPHSRRHIVMAWNPGELNQMCLPPCHMFFQLIVEELKYDHSVWLWKHWSQQYKRTGDIRFDKKYMSKADTFKYQLHMKMYIRSNDLFLGCPFNIAQYAMLLHMIAQQVDMYPGEFFYTMGSAHIYDNHKDQVALQCSRSPYNLPELLIKRKPSSIFDYNRLDFDLINYHYHPAIAGEVSV